LGDFFRIPSDNRDLNYSIYFSEGDNNVVEVDDYHSHNTERLNVEGVKSLISKLAIVRKELLAEDVDEFIA
jgi:UDP-glucose 4-epimerase